MSAQSVPDDRIRCPDCGQGTLEPQVRTEQFHYGEGKDQVLVEAENVPVEVCTHCQETFSGPEAARIRHNAICRALGLLTPEEIEALRKRLGLSQADLAELTGIGKATISRWERRWSLQNKAMDRYMRLLAANPENVRLLKNLPSAQPPPTPNSPRGPQEPTTSRVEGHFRKLEEAKLKHYVQHRDQLLKALNFAGSN